MTRIAVGAGLLALFVLSAPLAAQTSFDNDTSFMGHVNLHGDHSRLHIRLKPDRDSQAMEIVKEGFKVQVVGKEGDWYAIVPPSGSNGCWIHSKNVKVEGDRAHVTRDSSPVRIDSRNNAEIMTTLPKGTEVKIHRTHLGWHQISAPASVRYYVSAHYVEKDGYAKPPTDIVRTDDSAETSTVRDLLAEGVAEARRQMTSDEPNFDLAINLFSKAHQEAKQEHVKKEAQEWMTSLTEIQLTIKNDRASKASFVQTLAMYEKRLKAAEAAAAAAEKAAHQAAVQAAPPQYSHYGYLDSTPKYLNDNGAYVLLDQVGGKRVAFIKADKLTEKQLYGHYRQFIKISGVVEGKDGGLDIVRLEHAASADPNTENPNHK